MVLAGNVIVAIEPLVPLAWQSTSRPTRMQRIPPMGKVGSASEAIALKANNVSLLKSRQTPTWLSPPMGQAGNAVVGIVLRAQPA